jgi:glycosyltransferase involved in cell wall biosynthesis
MKTLSVVVPVFNEEATVATLIDKVVGVKVAGVKKEIIIIDDGSTDDSKLEIAKSIKRHKKEKLILIRHPKNLGKGAAVRSGIKKATGELLIIQDADLEYDPGDYKKILTPILDGKHDVVYGTRLANYPLHLIGRKKTPLATHYIGNKIVTLFTNLIFGSNLTDMETCYKAFRTKVLKGVSLYSNKFDIEPEITAKILKKGIKIHEVPIKVNPRGYHEGKKITWVDGFSAIFTLLKYRFS